MAPYMDKTTLYLDPEAYRRLKRIAADRKQTPAALVREAVAEYVARHGGTKLPASIGAGASRRGDLSERAEELLDGMGRPRRARARDRR
jgi:predicted transcriptional regulator